MDMRPGIAAFFRGKAAAAVWNNINFWRIAVIAASAAYVLLCAGKSLQFCSSMGRNTPVPVTGFRSTADSVRLLKKIYLLNVLKLPNEWYFAKTSASGGVSERFKATAGLLREKDPDAPGSAELIERYYNGGKPFMDPVWFNHPIICGTCGPLDGAGEITIVSVSAGLSTRVDMEDVHAVERHNGSFAVDQADALKRILGE